MARVANSMVTFQDLDDMVTFEGFSYVTNPIRPPSNLNTCATKLDVLGYLNVTLNRSIANNQLVSYSIIVSSINTNIFIIEVDTTNSGSSNANQFQFTGAEGDYDVVAKQSGTTVATFNNLSNEETITLPSNGNYILEVTPKETNGFNKIRFNNGGDKLKITDIKQWGNIVWSSFNSAFFGCGNMLVTATNTPNLSNVTDMSFMFFNANSFNQNINNWDVSNVTNMSFMFYDTNSFNQPLNNWDVSNVTDMNTMFYATTLFNQPLDNWDVSSVSNMDAMFSETSSFNQPLNNWDVSSVTSMGAMFFEASSFNQPLNNWDVSNVTNMSFMFYGTNSFNQPLNNWDVSSVSNMGAMFRNTEAFNQPLNNWDVSSVTIMSFMFYDTNSFNQPLDNWDVSSVTSMGAMFEDAESFNRDLSSWCVSNIRSEPSDFDTRASDWILANSRPVWGTCPGVIVDELEINPGTIEVDICPQTYDIIVTSNTSWTVSESLNWATLSTTSGSGDDTINVTLLENTSGIRSGTITFSTADVTVNHTITQQVSSIDTLRLDPDEINVPSNGISYIINVGSNTSWFTTQGTDLSWINFSRSSGSGCNTSISVTIDPNGSAITRNSQITISTGNITKIHEISQIGQGT